MRIPDATKCVLDRLPIKAMASLIMISHQALFVIIQQQVCIILFLVWLLFIYFIDEPLMVFVGREEAGHRCRRGNTGEACAEEGC